MSRAHGVVKGRRQQIIPEADLLPGYIIKILGFMFYISNRLLSPSWCFRQSRNGRQHCSLQKLLSCNKEMPIADTVMLYFAIARANFLGISLDAVIYILAMGCLL